MRALKTLSHGELRKRFSHLKNFDAWIAFLRRQKMLPKSIRKGNISAFKRGNVGVHPEITAGVLDKILKLRAESKSYDEIKKELHQEIEDLKFQYSAGNALLKDPRAKSDELINTYSAVLDVLGKYYRWDRNSSENRFYRNIPKDYERAAHEYFGTKIYYDRNKDKGTEFDDITTDKGITSERQMEFCLETMYFLIRHYEKLRREKKVKDIKV
jgi:hypothetical protein